MSPETRFLVAATISYRRKSKALL